MEAFYKFYKSILSAEINSREVLEILAVISALVYVFFAAKANKWCFIFGFISSAIYVYLAMVLHFYFDSIINTYYLFISVYGWIEWGKPQKAKSSIQSLSKKSFLRILMIGLSLSFVFAILADYFTDASLAYLDSMTTIFSFIASWMIVKKQLENWIIWIGVDLIAAAMYFYKELYLTALLFIFYTLMAFFGYIKWKRKIQNES